MLTLAGQHVLAAGAALQLESMSPPIPVVAFASAPYEGTPDALRVADIEAVITTIQSQLGLADEEVADLRPSESILESWYDSAPTSRTVEFAEKLLFTANLFRRGFTSTVVLDAFDDDPHGAWNNVPATAANADNITRILEGFYRELAASVDPSCHVDGMPVKLSDNVVMLVTGDTPKNSFSRAGWPDGSFGGDTFLYVRSNGWLNPGWFGDPASTLVQTNFNPISGAPDADASEESNDAAAIKGILYAISRGNEAAVELFDASPYDAVRAP